MKIQRVDTPWPHIITENILTTGLLRDCKNFAYSIEAPYNTRTVLHKDQISKQLLSRIFLEFTNHLFDIGRPLSDNEYLAAEFNVCGVGYQYNTIHVDIQHKLVSTVIYLSNKGIGTSLYRSNDPASFHSNVEWKVNRGLTFLRSENTWHDFGCGEINEPRRTLGINVKSVFD